MGWWFSHIERTTPRQPHVLKNNARWIPRDEVIVVNGIPVTGGWFYFGSQLKQRSCQLNDPSLVDPQLPTELNPFEVPHSINGPRPRYLNFSAPERRAYLEWLAGPRQGRGQRRFAWLYFYGIERRLALDDPQTEYEMLIAEVHRLMGAYGDCSRFLVACGKLLLYLNAPIHKNFDRLYKKISTAYQYDSASGAFSVSRAHEKT